MQDQEQVQPVSGSSTEPAEEKFPIAEMAVKAAVAIWVILFFTMIGFWVVRSASLGGAFVLLFIALLFYAGGTAIFMLKSHKWIAPDTADPEEKRIYNAIVPLAQAAGLPAPRIAIDQDDDSINAYTYGLNRNFAHIIVTRGLLDHVQPNDEEIKAILAHELGHVKNGDSVISSLLKFPIWVMDKVRWLLGVARYMGALFLRIFGGLFGGWIGLFILLGVLALLFYLSISIFFLTIIIAICMLCLNAFEREREYLADQYSASIVGSEIPLQHALAKLDLAQKRADEEIQKRIEAAGEGETVDTHVAPPMVAFEGSGFISEAMRETPTFWRSITSGEIFLSHPLSENRVYFLSKPHDRKRFWSNLLKKMEGFAGKILGDTESKSVAVGNQALITGGVAGALMGIIPSFTPDWLSVTLSMLVLIAGGLVIGYFAGIEGWSGQVFTRRVILASFVTSIALLVVGPIFNSEYALIFPIAFIVALILFSGFGFLGAKYGRERAVLEPVPFFTPAEDVKDIPGGDEPE